MTSMNYYYYYDQAITTMTKLLSYADEYSWQRQLYQNAYNTKKNKTFLSSVTKHQEVNFLLG